MFDFTPQGTCSSGIHFDLRDGRVYSVHFDGGCDGNLKALSRLVEGMELSVLAERLKGIDCGGRGTSCADQLVKAVETYAQG
jgi:uncharacterized protein (TIGR03905 family)